MGALANSEDPEEIGHNAAFHQSALFAKIKPVFSGSSSRAPATNKTICAILVEAMMRNNSVKLF